MELSNMLSREADSDSSRQTSTNNQVDQVTNRTYPTRRTTAITPVNGSDNTGYDMQEIIRGGSLPEIASGEPKTVSFELLVDEARKARARLPMRVRIFPQDSTEDVISSVKSFFGLYDDPQEVNFEDSSGNSIIARYENFSNDSTVSVRIVADHSSNNDVQRPWAYRNTSPQRLRNLDEVGLMFPPPQPAQILNYGQPPSRPLSRVSRKESLSPKPTNGRGSGTSKSRSKTGLKSHSSSFQAGLDELNDAQNGYSSSDGIAASVSSRKARSEQLATAEISVDNIVEGGRRKRAKFESSELPLFVPPQVPAPNSISSVSPQRRSAINDNDSPFARPQQRTFTYQVPVPSPNGDGFGPSIGNSVRAGGFTVPAVPIYPHRLRDRSSGASYSNRSSLGSSTYPKPHNVLPTPDPTVASCISDEDVALQLMRLGELNNFSHGRHSNSTFDDSLSGRADIASSGSNNSEDEIDENDQPTLPVLSTEHQPITTTTSVDHHIKKEVNENWPSTDGIEPSGDDIDDDYEDNALRAEGDGHIRKKQKLVKSKKSSVKPAKLGKTTASNKRSKQNSIAGNHPLPMSPASGAPHSRKASFASTTTMSYALGPDEDDLSSKPRCQRCRKSKKGCDRQRPCGRCKDAGIGIEGCISEDEGNGRKGRYGRHMGVAIKKGSQSGSVDGDFEHTGIILNGITTGSDQNKKRKRT